MQRNIILVTNDNKIEAFLKTKLVLLREADSIVVTNYANAKNDIEKYSSDIAVLYCSYEQEECLELIKEIKNTPVILLMENYDKDLLLAAFDAGIKDYLTLSSTDADVLIRIIWALQNKYNSEKAELAEHLLEELKIKEKDSVIYIDYRQIFDYEIEQIKKTSKEAVFMVISPTDNAKLSLDEKVFSDKLCSLLRDGDIIAKALNYRYYVLLNKTNTKGAFALFDRIKKETGIDVAAGISAVNNQTFDELEYETLNANIDALSTGKEVIVVNHDSAAETWIDEINSSPKKNFKLFKQAFNKKLENVIIPVFYRMQQLYEKNMPDGDIEQNVNEKQSIFVIKNGELENIFKITYPGFSKINIDIIHDGLDSAENKRVSFNINELNEDFLEALLDEFYKDTKQTLV